MRTTGTTKHQPKHGDDDTSLHDEQVHIWTKCTCCCCLLSIGVICTIVLMYVI